VTDRVVITGLGLVSPLGNDVESFWQGLLYRENLPSHYPYKNPGYMNNRRAYLVQDRDWASLPVNGERQGKATAFALRATEMALADAELLVASDQTSDILSPGSRDARLNAPTLIGICLGTGTGDSDLLEDEHEGGPSVNPLAAFSFSAAAAVANHFQTSGPNLTVSTACSAGCYSLSLARDAILDGWADVMIVGGTEVVSRVGQACFNRMNGLDPYACRPFDVDRAGTVYGEGAAILILESETHARRRGRERWLAEVKGCGWSCDGYHPTAPDPSTRQGELAMRRALAEANLAADAIDCVICHGTGTELNDVAESNCLQNIFGDGLEQLLICAIKSKLGHSGGASGAFSCLTAALILERGMVPPIANLTALDPRCNLNLHIGQPIQATVQNVLINAYAFGGNNISVVLGNCSGQSSDRA
jgi:3-oxoacyl-(acyl-carrier-protein) synthase